MNAVARPLLDGAAIQRRPAGREGETIWQRHADGAPGTTGRDRPLYVTGIRCLLIYLRTGGVLTAGWCGLSLPTRASARGIFPANPCGYTGLASRLRQFFFPPLLLWPHAMMSARRCALTLARRHPEDDR